MKKFLCIFVLAVVLVTALALPSFASFIEVDYGGHILPDVSSLVTSNMPYSLIYRNTFYNDVRMLVSDAPFTIGVYSGTEHLDEHGYTNMYVLSDGTWVNSGNLNTSLALRSNFEFYWTSHDVLYGDEVYWAHVEPVIPEVPKCDGSTCPANDVNSDGVCDDCGMTLSLRSFGNVYEVVVKHSEDLTLLYRYTEVETGTVFNAIYDNNRITVSFDNQVRHQQFKLVDGEWQEYNTVSIQWDNHVISHSADASIIRSDLDVFYPNGDYFFQIPLWEKVEGVTQGTLSTEAVGVHSTMMILTLCGVGLVALLIGLSLLVKVLPRFLKR